MCGFAGLLTCRSSAPGEIERIVRGMSSCLVHRGPDDAGSWADDDAGVALGFRRLAIIDLSAHGHQPMTSASGRYVMIFNGEVFNHRAIRAPLEASGSRFRGHSDTEVILAAFERYGVAAAVPRFVGMFAIAVWDRAERTLTLVRDRLGIKPLFVRAAEGVVTFGSELKALAAHPAFAPRLDRDALGAYFRYLYVPAPRTIYRDTIKLLPGHLLVVRDAGAPLPAPVPYWSAEEAARAGAANPFEGSDEEAVDALEEVLADAVRLRLEADVPLGALLSGGIDSSTVVALMQRASSRPVRTYSIGFDSAAHDETGHAAAVARHLGTAHTEMRVSGEEALAVVPRLDEMFDEPLADPSQIPTYLVCALTRRDVTVALTGDGGDEVFGGYNRYVHGARLIARTQRAPRLLRRAAGAGLSALTPPQWDRMLGAAGALVPRWQPPRLAGEKVHKVAALLREQGTAAAYRSLVSVWPASEPLVAGAAEPADATAAILDGGLRRPVEERMMLADQLRYLPDDLLAKVDRASMAVSLEARVPLLDHRVVEFGWRLPLRFKIRDGVGKWVLRRLLHRHVPPALVEREKMGFSVPIAQWLRGPLREWAEDLLEPRAMQADGLLDVHAARRAWTELLGGHDSRALGVWALVHFLSWQRRWRPAL